MADQHLSKNGSYVVCHLVSFTYLLEYLNKPFTGFNPFTSKLTHNDLCSDSCTETRWPHTPFSVLIKVNRENMLFVYLVNRVM